MYGRISALDAEMSVVQKHHAWRDRSHPKLLDQLKIAQTCLIALTLIILVSFS